MHNGDKASIAIFGVLVVVLAFLSGNILMRDKVNEAKERDCLLTHEVLLNGTLFDCAAVGAAE